MKINEELFKSELKKAIKDGIKNARVGYEWEQPEDKNARLRRMNWLRDEIKRISNTTLRGNFSKPEDKKYWEDRLKQLNSELSALEETDKRSRSAR